MLTIHQNCAKFLIRHHHHEKYSIFSWNKNVPFSCGIWMICFPRSRFRCCNIQHVSCYGLLSFNPTPSPLLCPYVSIITQPIWLPEVTSTMRFPDLCTFQPKVFSLKARRVCLFGSGCRHCYLYNHMYYH